MNSNTIKSVFTALFAALICAGALITIPLGPVPIVLQNAFAIMAGLLLGPLQGAGAVGIFLILGALGLPVFSGGRGGIAVLTGPTAGYLAGYFIGALVAGFAMNRLAGDKDIPMAKALPIIISATIMGFLVVYIPGVLVLRKALHLGLAEALAKGFTPFILGDLIKTAVVVPVVLKVRPIVLRYLNLDA